MRLLAALTMLLFAVALSGCNTPPPPPRHDPGIRVRAPGVDVNVKPDRLP